MLTIILYFLVQILCLMAFLSMCGILHLRLAALFISPVLVTMIRTFEIVMGLILDICLPSSDKQVDFASQSFIFKVAGCALVTLSAVLMAASNKISCCPSARRGNIVEPEEREPIKNGPK